MEVISISKEIEDQLPQEIQQVRRFLKQEVRSPKEVKSNETICEFY